ncbi:general secretion pathway protein GspA [Cellvibrio sp. KY-GH-1]|uniref:ExeA family protein n=1 Tax=Cellvibrio sp. KY-GH-1 TaxID=2303332 RepID=UPI001247638C|nr:AAA family ATPase [Cellvibrio sp. KY-GH-1]QEY15784.1 general secretion pathway protein GspA [Cellvibrio sp. KY-GH-1]
MYHEFFGLKEPAFSIAVNPRYLFMSDQHREALAHLLYGIQNGGFVMLTGEVGTGKTTIIRCLLEQLPGNTDIAIILNPMASAPELLSTICDELGVEYIADELTVKVLTDALNQFLLDNHRKGRKTVLLIDEAQLLKVPVLEQIRLLTNLETTTEKLLQIMLVGQPELKKLLARPALRQLSQRITARFHLEALNLVESKAYIYHRLKVAGMPEHQLPFSDAIIKKIHEFSGGIPRLINVICERLLLGAYAQNRHQVDKQIFAAAVKEVAGTATQQEVKEAAASRTSWHAVFVGVVALVMAGVWFLVPDQVPANATSSNTQHSSVDASLVASGSVIDARRFVSSVATSSSSAIAAPVENLLTNVATRDQVAAQLALFKFAGLNAIDKQAPCTSLNKSTYECAKAKLNSWDELKELNRPGVMTLATPDKKWVYALLIGLSENHALFLVDGAEKVIPWSELVVQWNGDFLYVWSRPAGFEGSLQLGDRSDLVTWVAEQFAKLDQQPAPLTRQFFTDRLQKRIELFQANNGILPDGVFNEQTLRRLNEALGMDKPLAELDEQKLQQQIGAKGL